MEEHISPLQKQEETSRKNPKGIRAYKRLRGSYINPELIVLNIKYSRVCFTRIISLNI